MAYPDASLDDKEELALGTLEGGAEEHWTVAEISEPGVDSQAQRRGCWREEEGKREEQLQLESSEALLEAHSGWIRRAAVAGNGNQEELPSPPDIWTWQG